MVSDAKLDAARDLLNSGIGFGVSGLQLSVMPKAALGRNRNRLILGLGPSLGINIDDGARSTWLNGDIGYEHRSDGGLSVAVSVGFTAGIAGCLEASCLPGGGEFADDDESTAFFSQRASDYAAPQARIAIGRWF